MMLLKPKTPKLLIAFLIICSQGCASNPRGSSFDAQWAFCEVIPMEESWACLKKNDVIKLKTILNECKRSER